MNAKMIQLIPLTSTLVLTVANCALAQTWAPSDAPVESWSGIASSADGTKLVAVADGGGIYTSADSGNTWVTNEAPYESWIATASSADGTKLVAASFGSYPDTNSGVYVSTNSGATWIKATNNLPQIAWWTSVATSADGVNMVAAMQAEPGLIYRSTDSGVTWTPTGAPYGTW